MKYKGLTLEKLKAAIKEFYHGKDINFELTIEQLKEKILPGFAYTVQNSLGTGRGGILMYIDACDREGVPAFQIQESIKVYLPLFGDYVPLANVNLKP